jgi:hypothetical protein
MEIDSAKSLSDIFHYVENLNTESTSWIFRGQADSSWDLNPKIGRKDYQNNIDSIKYQIQFQQWVMIAENYIDLPKSEWAKLAIAQHYGLATHYLDWTTNPFIALFFAVNDIINKDGTFFALETSEIEYLAHNDIKISDVIDPLNQMSNDRLRTDAWLCRLKPTIGRIVNQHSVLTFHADPKKDLRDCNINSNGTKPRVSSLKIDSKSKIKILDELHLYGINYKTVFPDIDGITKQINSDLSLGNLRY